MKKVGITELRSNLSRYLDQVKRGNPILVLQGNQPVAQIVPLQKAARSNASDEARIARLERKGLIRRGGGGSGQWLVKRRLVKVPGSVLQDLLDERRSGR
jgi:prevent-host-death family protein